MGTESSYHTNTQSPAQSTGNSTNLVQITISSDAVVEAPIACGNSMRTGELSMKMTIHIPLEAQTKVEPVTGPLGMKERQTPPL